MMTRVEFIVGRQRAVDRLAAVDVRDRPAVLAALLVVQAFERLPEMLPAGFWR